MSNAGDAATKARENETAQAQNEAARPEPGASEIKPDVSDQGAGQLLPKLLNHFNNNREELARALGLHRSTVDRWMNGTSRPNNSTLLRMRRIAQERLLD